MSISSRRIVILQSLLEEGRSVNIPGFGHTRSVQFSHEELVRIHLLFVTCFQVIDQYFL